MSRILRRVYTTATTSVADAIPSAKQVAERFLSDLKGLTRTRRQVLDGNQLRKLATLLGRLDNEAAFRVGERIPPCYHLAYFTPEEREEELGVDGTDKTWNPGWPFTRRMWAGGEMEWLGGREVRVGDEVKERTEVINAEGKKTKAGEEMVVVGVRKEYSGEGEGVHLVDKRNWLFRPPLASPAPVSTRILPVVDPPSSTHFVDHLQTATTLFRFSALTYNAHKIHLDRQWCREVEGHRDLVVHGPLNLILMLDFWRDIIGEGVAPRRVKYRATHPIYVGDRYRICMEKEDIGGGTEMKIVDQYGNIGMVGRIERF